MRAVCYSVKAQGKNKTDSNLWYNVKAASLLEKKRNWSLGGLKGASGYPYICFPGHSQCDTVQIQTGYETGKIHTCTMPT